MADLSDVSDALVDAITATIYPNGSAGPPPDFPVKVYSGWPDPKTLDEDLQGDPAFPMLHVSVFNLPMERIVNRYPSEWEEIARPAPTFAAQIVGQSVLISGGQATPYQPQNIAINVDGQAWSRRILPGETTAQIAAALADLISPTWSGTAAFGSTVTIPAPGRILNARVGVLGTVSKEVGRQEKGFQVTLWANTHENRVWLAKKVVPVLADTLRLTLADGSRARMICRSNSDMDRAQHQGAYRRDLVYTVEYATTRELAAPEMIVARTEFKAPDGAAIVTKDE